MSINKDQAVAEIIIIKERLLVLEGIINAPEKPTAKQWLKDFIKLDFTVKITEGYITCYLGDQWIFQEDFKNKVFWCYYYKGWQVFEKEYGLKYEQIQALYKKVVLKTFNCEGFTPLWAKWRTACWC